MDSEVQPQTNSKTLNVFYIRAIDTKEGLDIEGPFIMGICETEEEVKNLVMSRSRECSGTIIEVVTRNHDDFDAAKTEAYKKLYEIADKMFESEELLNRSRPSSSSADSQEICPKCNRTFRKKYALTNHLRHCQQEQKETYKCKTCARKFHKPFALTNHMRYCTKKPIKRKGKEEFVCKYCGKVCSTNYGLSNHIRWCKEKD
jgi:hypothetical protein